MWRTFKDRERMTQTCYFSFDVVVTFSRNETLPDLKFSFDRNIFSFLKLILYFYHHFLFTSTLSFGTFWKTPGRLLLVTQPHVGNPSSSSTHRNLCTLFLHILIAAMCFRGGSPQHFSCLLPLSSLLSHFCWCETFFFFSFFSCHPKKMSLNCQLPATPDAIFRIQMWRDDSVVKWCPCWDYN